MRDDVAKMLFVGEGAILAKAFDAEVQRTRSTSPNFVILSNAKDDGFFDFLCALRASASGSFTQTAYTPVRAISIRRATRSSVAGWVENNPAMPRPDSGFMIII